jgi:hypothetical protein
MGGSQVEKETTAMTLGYRQQRDWLEDLRELLLELEETLPPTNLRSRVLDMRLFTDRQIEERKDHGPART